MKNKERNTFYGVNLHKLSILILAVVCITMGNDGTIIIVKPNLVLGPPTPPAVVDSTTPKIEPQKIKKLTLKAGTYQLLDDKDSKKQAVLSVETGKTYYLINSKDAESQEILGNHLFNNGDKEGALAAYRTTLKLDPKRTTIYKNYATLIADEGDPEEVIKVLNGVISSGQADSSTHLALAKVYTRQKKYGEAIKIFTNLIQKSPNNGEYLSAMAKCKMLMGNTQGAIADIQKALPLLKNPKNEYLLLGDLYKKSNIPAKATMAYEKYFKAGGKNENASETVGLYYYGQKEYDKAAPHLLSLGEEKSKNIEILKAQANTLYFTKQYKESYTAHTKLNKKSMKKAAKIKLRREIYPYILHASLEINGSGKTSYSWLKKTLVIKKNRKDQQLSYLNAWAFEKINKKKSLIEYQKNIKKFPKDFRNFLRLGLIYSNSKNKKTLAKAGPLLKKAANLAEDMPNVWLDIADIYKTLRKPAEEISAYQNYLKSDSKNVDVNGKLAILLVRDQKYTEAIPHLTVCYSAEPKKMEYALYLADAYIKTKQYVKATPILEQGKKDFPQNSTINEQLMNVYQKTGKTDNALKELKTLVDKEGSIDLRYTYAQTLMSKKTKEANKEALENLEMILGEEPEHIEALLLLGKLYTFEKKYNEAVNVYKELLYLDPQNPNIEFNLGEVYREQGKVMWAENSYKKVLRVDENYGLAHLGLAHIAKLRKQDSKYKDFVKKAFAASPENEQIIGEYKKIQK